MLALSEDRGDRTGRLHTVGLGAQGACHRCAEAASVRTEYRMCCPAALPAIGQPCLEAGVRANVLS